MFAARRSHERIETLLDISRNFAPISPAGGNAVGDSSRRSSSRAQTAKPKLLMLAEPSMGLALS